MPSVVMPNRTRLGATRCPSRSDDLLAGVWLNPPQAEAFWPWPGRLAPGLHLSNLGSGHGMERKVTDRRKGSADRAT
jgi:hypothetical protein